MKKRKRKERDWDILVDWKWRRKKLHLFDLIKKKWKYVISLWEITSVESFLYNIWYNYFFFFFLFFFNQNKEEGGGKLSQIIVQI